MCGSLSNNRVTNHSRMCQGMGSSVDNRCSVDNRGSVGRGNVSRCIRIYSSSIIGDCSDVSVDGVGGVANMLDAAVRKVDTVRTLGIASSVTGLGSIEVGGGVVVSHGVVVCVGGDLVRIDFRGSVSNDRSVVGRGSVDYRSSVNYGCSMNYRGSVNYRSNSMGNGVSSNKSVSSHQSVSSNKTMVSSNEELRSTGGSSHQARNAEEDLENIFWFTNLASYVYIFMSAFILLISLILNNM